MIKCVCVSVWCISCVCVCLVFNVCAFYVSLFHSFIVLSFSSAAEAMMFSVGWQAVHSTVSV